MRLIPEISFTELPKEIKASVQPLIQRFNDGLFPNGFYLADLLYNRATRRLERGEVVVIDTTTDNGCNVTGTASNIRRCGVVVKETAVNALVPIAVTGIVDCRVRGEVKSGDILTTSSNPGIAVVNNVATIDQRFGFSLQSVKSSQITQEGFVTIKCFLTI